MSAQFVSASSQYLKNDAAPLPSTGYPLTVGFWAYPVTLSNTLFALTSTANATNYLSLSLFNTVWAINANSGTNNQVAGPAGIANAWQYIVARFISATNRRLSVLLPDGSINSAAQGTTSKAPAGMTRLVVGALAHSTPTQFYNGSVAELWYTNTDIQPDGLALSDITLRQLAYGGPFSVPHIIKDIQEYRSLRSTLTSDQDKPDEFDFGGAGRQTWANTNGVTLGPHPPLPYWYEKPIDIVRPCIPI